MSSPKSYRIAVVAACPFPEPRGTPVRIRRLSEALAARGHDVHVITYHLGETYEGPLTVHRTPRVPTYRKRSAGPSFQKLTVMDPLLAHTLRRVLRRHEFDIVHAHHVESVMAAVVAGVRSRMPLIYDAHTLVGAELPHYQRRVSRQLLRALGDRIDVRVPLASTHVVAVTTAIARHLTDADPRLADRVSVIPNGVEWEHFDVPRAVPAADEPRRIVYAGNLAPFQNIDLLLEAFRLVRSRRRDARLRFVTDSDFAPYEPLARSLAVRDAIDVVSSGFEALPGELARADVAVLPRLGGDGIPQKLLNYMAAGAPIVAFRSASAWLVDGEHALLAPDGDAGVLSLCMERMLDDREHAADLGRQARDYVRREFSWAAAAERVESVYARLLSPPVLESAPAAAEPSAIV